MVWKMATATYIRPIYNEQLKTINDSSFPLSKQEMDKINKLIF